METHGDLGVESVHAEKVVARDVFSTRKKNRCQVIRADKQDWARHLWHVAERHKRPRQSFHVS